MPLLPKYSSPHRYSNLKTAAASSAAAAILVCQRLPLPLTTTNQIPPRGVPPSLLIPDINLNPRKPSFSEYRTESVGLGSLFGNGDSKLSPRLRTNSPSQWRRSNFVIKSRILFRMDRRCTFKGQVCACALWKKAGRGAGVGGLKLTPLR